MAAAASDATSQLIKSDDEENKDIDSLESTITPRQKSAALVLLIYNSLIVSVIYSLLLPFFSQVVSMNP